MIRSAPVRGCLVALLALGCGCERRAADTSRRDAGPAPSQAPSRPAAAAAVEAKASSRDPSWPCTSSFAQGGVVTERARFVYQDSPKRCSFPPDVDVFGCPSEEQELTADGALKRTLRFEYDPAGNVVSLAYVAKSGQTTTTLRYERDAKGLSRMTVIGPDGAPHGGNRYTKTADGFAREQLDERGNVVRKASYHYDERGLLKSAEVDHGADGTIDVRMRNTFDGARVVRTDDVDGAGKSLGVATYAYDCP